jgi:hypothetical protein
MSNASESSVIYNVWNHTLNGNDYAFCWEILAVVMFLIERRNPNISFWCDIRSYDRTTCSYNWQIYLEITRQESRPRTVFCSSFLMHPQLVVCLMRLEKKVAAGICIFRHYQVTEGTGKLKGWDEFHMCRDHRQTTMPWNTTSLIIISAVCTSYV